MHICLIWMLLVHSILGRFLLPYWDVSFVHLNKININVPLNEMCPTRVIEREYESLLWHSVQAML
jgi:hypothetical protein